MFQGISAPGRLERLTGVLELYLVPRHLVGTSYVSQDLPSGAQSPALGRD